MSQGFGSVKTPQKPRKRGKTHENTGEDCFQRISLFHLMFKSWWISSLLFPQTAQVTGALCGLLISLEAKGRDQKDTKKAKSHHVLQMVYVLPSPWELGGALDTCASPFAKRGALRFLRTRNGVVCGVKTWMV